jgi:hypothetical protein
LEDSVQCLDTLLEQYLHLLDRQQKLHSSLAEQLSSVCLCVIMMVEIC